MHQAIFRECLETLDVDLARRVWAETCPHLPPLGKDAIGVLHYSRTQAECVHVKKRAYSHRWLIDRGLPSGLPDRLKPSADRLYPRVEGCVGIATKTRSSLANAIREAMEYAVNECYADGHREPHIVKPRMMELRQRILRG